ncbi:MAG: glycosyltransferase family 4 protein [Acidobacteriota bacterium]
MRIAYLHYLHSAKDGTRDRTRHFTDAIRDHGHEIDIHPMNLARDLGVPVGETSTTMTPTRTRRLRSWAKKRFGRWLHEPKELVWNLPYSRKENELLTSIPRPDVLYVRPSRLGVSITRVAKRHDLPLLLEIHAPMAERLQTEQYWRMPIAPEEIERYRLRRASAITVVSRSLGRYLATRYDVDERRFAVVHNGADVARFHPDTPRDPEVVERLGDGPVVGFVGSFKEWHDADLLADVISRVAASRPEARFLLVGDGPTVGAVQPVVDSLGERALLLPWVAHARMPALMASIDIGILPAADFYRCPLKVVEWMAAGTVPVLPDHSPIHELATNGEQGLYFSPGDRKGCADAVRRLLDNETLRTRLSHDAARRARAEMTWPKRAELAIDACHLAMRWHRHDTQGTKPETGPSPLSEPVHV